MAAAKRRLTCLTGLLFPVFLILMPQPAAGTPAMSATPAATASTKPVAAPSAPAVGATPSITLSSSVASSPGATATPAPNAQIESALIQSGLALVGSIIVAAITVSVSLWNESRRRATDQKLKQLDLQTQQHLAQLRTATDLQVVQINKEANLRLADINAAHTARLSAENARREYEYTALKRLYAECEPVLFQLSQTSRVAIGRIKSLAREARDGNLSQGGLLSDPTLEHDYFFRSTLYQLLAPVAIAYLFQTRLTLIDLRLDPYIRRQFNLSENLYKTYARDYFFAEQPPAIVEYGVGSNAKRGTNGKDSKPSPLMPSQGLYLGHLDRTVEALLYTVDGNTRLRTFGHFEQAFLAGPGNVAPEFRPVVELFRDFHPGTRPVLWRILIAQYYLLRALRMSVRADLDAGQRDPTLTQLVLDMPKEEDLLWVRGPVDNNVRTLHEAALTTGYRYLQRYVDENTAVASQI